MREKKDYRKACRIYIIRDKLGEVVDNNEVEVED